MNITVMAPMGADKVKEVLLANADPKYTFVKALGIMQTYAVEDPEGKYGDLPHYTKKLIMTALGANFNVAVRTEGSAY